MLLNSPTERRRRGVKQGSGQGVADSEGAKEGEAGNAYRYGALSGTGLHANPAAPRGAGEIGEARDVHQERGNETGELICGGETADSTL